jgi:large subunit ribosomal protein L6
MSRVGKNPVVIGKGVDVTVDGSTVTVKGPKGTMVRTFPKAINIALEEQQVVVTRPSDSKEHKTLHGMTRATIANMVRGVSEGYRKDLIIEGTGYRVEERGKGLTLSVGFSHPVLIDPPTGISFEVPKGNKQLGILGIDKEVVGQVAAEIRGYRPPEPYKGKGIRYSDETIRRKAGKAGKGK